MRLNVLRFKSMREKDFKGGCRMSNSGGMDMQQIVAVIPVYNPSDFFERDVEQLQQLGFAQIIIVNDGSSTQHRMLFERLQKKLNIIVLTHEQKLGKTEAVKTAASYVQRYLKRCKGLLFIGAYGQHKVSDVAYMLHMSRIYNDGIVLGVRSFRSRELPPFSRLGNLFVTISFELKCKKRVVDVQTSLRYIPMPHLSWIRRIEGRQFEIDVYMLMEAVKRDIPLYEVYIGQASVKKNTFIQYDESFRFRQVAQKIWRYRYLAR